MRDYFLYCKNDGAARRCASPTIKFFYTVTLPMEWEAIKRLRYENRTLRLHSGSGRAPVCPGHVKREKTERINAGKTGKEPMKEITAAP